MDAISHGHIETINILINRGANLNNLMLFRWAVVSHRIDIINLLINKGVPVQA